MGSKMLEDPIFRIPHLFAHGQIVKALKELEPIEQQAHVESEDKFRKCPSYRYIEFRINDRLLYLSGTSSNRMVVTGMFLQFVYYLQTVSGRARDLGNTAFAAHNYPLAADYYAIAAQFDPFDMRPPLNLAAIHLRTGQQPAAFAAAHRAMLLGWTYGGSAVLQDKARARAAAANPAAASQMPHPSWSQYAISTGSPYVGCSYEAKSCAAALTSRYKVEMALGNAWQSPTGNAQMAAEHFAAEIALRPAEAGTYIQRSGCWLYLGEYAQAAQDANRAVQLTDSPWESAIAIWAIGMCEFLRKRYADSRRAFRTAGQLRKANAVIEQCARKLRGSEAGASAFFEDTKRKLFEEGISF